MLWFRDLGFCDFGDRVKSLYLENKFWYFKSFYLRNREMHKVCVVLSFTARVAMEVRDSWPK